MTLEALRKLGIIAPARVGPAHAVYTLPWPPTVNNYRAIVNGRFVTVAEGRQHKRNVLAALASQGFQGRRDAFLKPDRLAVIMEAYADGAYAYDLDNRQKAPLDVMQEAGLIENDNQIDVLAIIRRGVVPGGKLVVRIARLGDATQSLFF